MLVLTPSAAEAQGCVRGRLITEATEGRCCWRGQSWSSTEFRCVGAPICPEGWGGDGTTCVLPTAPARWGAHRLAAPVPTYERRVNHNVLGGAVALFLTTYGGSIAFAFDFASGWCVGPIPFLVPLGSFIGVTCGFAYTAALGVAFGLGQLVSIFLMVAGGSFFRRRGAIRSVGWNADGLSIAF